MILSEYERRVARCFCAATFPAAPAGALPAEAGAGTGAAARTVLAALPDGGEVGMDAMLEQLLERAPVRMRLGTRLALWAFALAPLLLLGRLALATALAPAEREVYVGRWLAHRVYFIRSIAFFLKAFAAMAYFRDRRVQGALGLPGA